MKYVKDHTGRFSERPHYEPRELDTECESIITKHLKELYGEAKFPVRTDDLTKLIELEADALDVYADLSAYGANVEGVTEFRPGKKPLVFISKELAEDERRENRFRTTLTHEYGHVRYHSYLWDFHAGQLTISAGTREMKAVCKRETIVDAPQSDWMEWQAGHVCGAILMPASHVRRLAGEYAEEEKLYAPIHSVGDHATRLVEIVASGFAVSTEAARVRLLRLRVLGDGPTSPSLFST